MSTLTQQIQALQQEALELNKELNRSKDEDVKAFLQERITLLKDAAESLKKYRDVVLALQVQP